MTSSAPSRLLRLMALASVALPTACVQTTTTSDGRAPAPEPIRPVVTPPEAPITAVVLVASPPIDTNGNLWRDRIDVTVYLFAQPHPTPAFRDGTLELAIYEMGGVGSPDHPGRPLRTWTFDPGALAASRSMAVFGPCHQLSLSLLADGGDDRLPVDSVDLMASFRPRSGDPVRTQGVTTIQMGKIPASSASRPGLGAS